VEKPLKFIGEAFPILILHPHSLFRLPLKAMNSVTLASFRHHSFEHKTSNCIKNRTANTT